MGNRGTMIVEEEHDLLLYKEPDRNPAKSTGAARTTSIVVEKPGGQADHRGQPEPGRVPRLAAILRVDRDRRPVARLSRGTGALRLLHPQRRPQGLPRHHRRQAPPPLPGEVALADAVIALTSNLAMKQKRRIEFREAWFDPSSDDVPDVNVARG